MTFDYKLHSATIPSNSEIPIAGARYFVIHSLQLQTEVAFCTHHCVMASPGQLCNKFSLPQQVRLAARRDNSQDSAGKTQISEMRQQAEA